MPNSKDVLEELPCGLARTTLGGTFLWANRTFCTWVAHDAGALVGRLTFQQLLTAGGRIFLQTHWRPLLEMQGSVSEVKLEISLPDGARLPVVVNAVRRERDGTMVHEIACFVARDRDKYERELLASRRELQELVAEATRHRVFAEQMMGIVGHDLRTPLSTVVMGASLLERQELTEAQRSVVRHIRRASDRAVRLVGDLLDFTQARIGSGLTSAPSEVDAHAVVGEALDELRFADATRVIEHVRVGEGTCSVDPHRLGQLTGNLVVNALAYGTRGTAVRVTTEIEPMSFCLAVHNDGTPIPADLQESLFKPMTRGTEARGGGRSVGLGLYIVREIARVHGGSVTVHSTANEGTTFRARFPRAAARVVS